MNHSNINDLMKNSHPSDRHVEADMFAARVDMMEEALNIGADAKKWFKSVAVSAFKMVIRRRFQTPAQQQTAQAQ